MLIDTHCHIHESDYPLDIADTLQLATQHKVEHMICVGTNLDSSRRAIVMSRTYAQLSASIGVHPHDTHQGTDGLAKLFDPDETPEQSRIVAVGEIGLDYFYTHSPRDVQIIALEYQIDLAQKHNLPIIFHVRDAFDDFWPIFDNFPGIRGVLHSFTDTQANVEAALSRNLYIGVNGISTFTRDETQKTMFASIPLQSLLLETDAPFLTPVPLRGTVNQPAFVSHVATHHASIRSVSLETLASVTSANARALFAL